MNTDIRPDTANILDMYAKLKSCQTIASDFGVNLKPHCDAAASCLGATPAETLANTTPSSLAELHRKIEALAKGAIAMLCKSQADYYNSEFHRRLEAIAESSELTPLKESVDTKYREAITLFSSSKSQTFDEFWKVSNQSVQFLLCSANLVSRHGALSAIASALGVKEDSSEVSSEVSSNLLDRAKGALKIESPKELLPTDDIDRIKSSFLNEIRGL